MWKILVVDDNFFNRKLILMGLDDFAKIDMAVNVEEAEMAYTDSLDKTPYDLILLDIALPDKDGIEYLRWVRKEEAARGIPLGKGIPIIMTTAHDNFVSQSYNEGCDDYILKPIRLDDLLEKIEARLGPAQKN